MRAIRFDNSLRYVSDQPLPQRPVGEALIHISLAGICNTDLEIVRGYQDHHGVMGHEFVGVVEAADDTAWIGKRVVGDINASCGVCPTCTAGMHTHCPTRTTLGISGRDGVFADYTCLPEANLYEVPLGVPDEAAVFTEPLAAAVQIVDQVRVRPTDQVVVLGDGKLGLLVAAVLRLSGCSLTLVGKHPNKLDIARAWQINTLTGAGSLDQGWADVVVECTGSPSGFAEASRLVRPRGILVLKSTYADELRFDASRLVVNEVTLVGSRCGPFVPAIRLLREGHVDPRPLISDIFQLTDGLEAVEHASKPGILKVLLKP